MTPLQGKKKVYYGDDYKYMTKIIIAIDGPAASGKSTAAKLLAQKLGYVYLDTGAMYRASALAAQRADIAMDDEAALAKLMQHIQLDISFTNLENQIFLAGEDVSVEIRKPEISMLASNISRLKSVREKMVELQRRMGKDGGVILDGRDIGTVVFPDAQLKFFLDAPVELRAERRYKELLSKGQNALFEEVLSEMKQRDLQDSSRALAPLVAASDAIHIDTSAFGIQELSEELYRYFVAQAAEKRIVRLAPYSGFCFGVRRALQLALDASREYGRIYTLGELIHNPQVVEEMANQGVMVAKDIADLREAIVVIRSHGISKEQLEVLNASGNTIIDATCPYVKRTHELIQKANEEGYPVIILGDPNHPEVIGIKSYGDENTVVYEPAQKLPALIGKKYCVISQTTQKLENLEALVNKLLPLCNDLKIYNSICLATTQRQNASEALAQDSDIMIIIGGKNSSNTKMLANLCQKYTECIHIETEDELQESHLKGKWRIGLAAGASTPESRIIIVYNKILKINGDNQFASKLDDIPLFKEESC